MKSFRFVLAILALAFVLVTCSKDSPTDSTDTTAPGAIVNLTILGTVDTTALLAWTAPGDDGYEGTATSYDIRYATDSLVLKNWSNAYAYPNPPEPLGAGNSQQHEVGGLSLDSSYFFGIKATDDVGNVSDLSNLASQEVPEAPRVFIISHANGDEVADLVDIVAVAVDNKGITKVEFFVDTLSIGIDITPPYTAQWNAHSNAHASDHIMYAVATDTDNNSSGSSTITVIIDTQLSIPSELELLQPSSITDSSFYLTWGASADNDFNSYRIWWTFTEDVWPNNWASHLSTSVDDTSYTITGLYDNTKYSYRFVIRDVFGHERQYDVYDVTTQDVPPPTALSSVWRTSQGAIIRWRPLDIHDFESYRVYRSTDDMLDATDFLLFASSNINDSITIDESISLVDSAFYFVQVEDTSRNTSTTDAMMIPVSYGHCLRFDGNQRVVIPVTDTMLGGPVVTVELWLALANTSQHSFVLSQGAGQLELEVHSPSTFTPHVSGSCWNRTSSGIGELEWHHMAIVTDRTLNYSNLYVDAILVDSMQCSGYSYYSGPLVLGMRSSSYGYYGLIDELRIWNHARAVEDLDSNKNKVLVGNEVGLVGYWTMDEGLGTQINGIGGIGILGENELSPTWEPSTAPLEY